MKIRVASLKVYPFTLYEMAVVSEYIPYMVNEVLAL